MSQNNERRCVIVGGAEIADYKRIAAQINLDDFFIFCDGGVKHAAKLGVEPSLIVGDFDSSEKPDCYIETIVLPREKDDTDSFFAAREALSRGFTDFLLIGTVGGRLDHTLCNLSLLLWLENHGAHARMSDDYSDIEIISNKAFVGCEYEYFSLIAIGVAEGVFIKNAKFPLSNAEISPDYQFAVSNEPLSGQTAEITVNKGKLLLIKDIFRA